ncbi:hypothetical protein LOZ39_004388 [Ophidiomyces ophidiicola]|nr:hypothetical protein LOZ49_002921 [Ophidiomyces ophidiicola]KAI2012581.1 hypothetical protein LOZ50_000037 [Ophidiomyces ophidiicola]KAI2053221.1 hypothetical protein LOZ44_002707 [Ophidiomyces ophidiicola]KAI2072175.1 hypothetical protein LOZ39_004388 [Ophidiomyces ophidiicola]KAI2133635.1 hypothetical protein LOZ29_004593 [Ophidiomyces ophidiicola]
MEIFCRNIPEQIQASHLKKAFRPVLEHFSISTFSCRRAGKKNAFLLILDIQKAQKLLDVHGQDEAKKTNTAKPLILFHQRIYLSKSRHAPDEYALRALKFEEEKRLAYQAPVRGSNPPPSSVVSQSRAVRTIFFPVTTMSCGIWDYYRESPVFIEYFRCPGTGRVTFGKSLLQVVMLNVAPSTEFFLKSAYWNIQGIHVGTADQASVTFTTDTAPSFFISDPMKKLESQMMMLMKKLRKPPPAKRRVGNFGGEHEITSGSCFTYRFELQNRRDVHIIKGLGGDGRIPPIGTWVDRRMNYAAPFSFSWSKAEFEKFLDTENILFILKFQLVKLVWNGEISPDKVSRLYPSIQNFVDVHGVYNTVEGLKIFSHKLDYASPDTDASEVDVEGLVKLLGNCIDRVTFQGTSRLTSHPNNVNVHRAQVTPSGIYLSGPNTETKNRVLRQYSDHINYFLRVEFVDETGDPVYFDPTSSLEQIFQNRFKTVLKKGIAIGGRCFSFLGFSHSSLRSQSCWFVAPFTTANGENFDAQSIINGLGSFGHIFSPAKLAARVGQTFSETQSSIRIPENAVYLNEPDVRRNGRVFSDGVGTLSSSLLYKVWREYALREKVKPTVFQIRFAGAKGMVSLDSRLKGDQLRLRESMVKFSASKAFNIEICGSGVRSLPFYLNAQLIKILEDLGVCPIVFMDLQKDEIIRLRSVQHSISKAGQFLEETSIAKGVRLSWLFQILHGLDLRYDHDPFLRTVMQLAVFLKMRDLKYRARIRVPQAVTLYGIMDETGLLKEGEIFCTFLTEAGIREILVRDRILVTRAPALHPGDVQYAKAVDVPVHSPLRKLHNCVAFSQHGKRDLPSMLSGGDLDGDLYNIIYDERLFPPRTHEPANYPKVEEKLLERQVQRDDIIDFFITFMQQDQLGRIATIHQAIADQMPEGTNHTVVADPYLRLQADLSRIPRRPRFYPDFMAPNPRIRISDTIEAIDEDTYIAEDDEDDERPPRQYYKSHNILGQLYRNIDEQEFLGNLRNVRKIEKSDKSVLQAIWAYVTSETQGFQWDHFVQHSRSIQEIYEDNLQDIMKQYSKTPWKSSLTEVEVFVGSILGQNSKQTKRDKESSKSMRDAYQELVNFTISKIVARELGTEDSLERSVACLWSALFDDHHFGHGRKTNKLLSFQWIAAMVCLQEVDWLQSTTLF